NGHARVNRAHQFIGCGGDDRRRAQLVALVITPVLPQTSEGKWLFIRHGDVHGTPRPTAGAVLPLIEPIGRDQAAPPSPGVAEGRPEADTLGPGEAHPVAD